MSKELMSLEEIQKQLAVVAVEENSNEKVTSSRHLSVKGRRFSLGDERLGEELDVVVVATSFENAYYESAYNPDKVQPPSCFAVAEKESDLESHATSPNAQGDSCSGCPMNEWGSGSGKSKACKNGRRLVLLAYGKDGLDDGDAVVLRLPPTSLKNWSSYAKAVTARTGVPTFAVVTRLSFDPKSDWPVVTMNLVKPIDNASELTSIMERQQEFKDIAVEPYDVSNYDKEETKEISQSKKSKMS